MAYATATNSTTLTSTGGNKATLTATLTENSYSVANNTSNVTITASIYQSTGSFAQISSPMLYVDWYDNVSGSWVNKASVNVTAMDRYETKTATSTFNVTHASNGKLTGQVRARWVYSGSSAWPAQSGSISTASTALYTIPRYFTTMTISLGTRTDEISLPINWSTSETCNKVEYSLDKGSSWTVVSTASGTSGSFTIGDEDNPLSAGTSYTVYVRCTRADSNLATTKNGTWSTHPYPSLTAVGNTNYTIGSGAISFTLNNPLNRTCTITMKAGDYSTATTTSSTSASITPSASGLYATIPTKTSGTATYTCSYSTASNSLTGTYKCNESDCVPDVTNVNLLYKDLNESVSTILGGNDQYLVQNQSELGVLFEAASPMNSATISKYTILLNGSAIGDDITSVPTEYLSRGTISLNKNATLALKVTDSRGYTATSSSVDVNILPWSKPSIAVTAARENNFNKETTISSTIVSYTKLTIGEKEYNEAYRSISYSYCEGTKYKESEKIDSGIISVDDNGKPKDVVLELDQSKNYAFEVVLSDAFDKATAYAFVSRGIPIMMVDGKQLGVGINCFPETAGLYVNGKLLQSYYNIDLSSLDTTQFYPVIFPITNNVIDCEIHSTSGSASLAYNQNVIHFQLISSGWSDTPPCFSILQYNVYSTSEITIGCIGRGTTVGNNCVWLRGGIQYDFYCNFPPTLYSEGYEDTNYTDTKEVFSVGSNYYGGENTRVSILFTPQTTIKKGSYLELDDNFLDKIYPKGSIYMSTQNISPASFLGGTWTPLQDRFLVGAGSSYAVNAKGGATSVSHSHTVNSHTHTIAASTHKHGAGTLQADIAFNSSYIWNYYDSSKSFTPNARKTASGTSVDNTTAQSEATRVAGSTADATIAEATSSASAPGTDSKTISTLPPYLAVYMWERTA